MPTVIHCTVMTDETVRIGDMFFVEVMEFMMEAGIHSSHNKNNTNY